MTVGHKHRIVHVKSFDILPVRLIRLPVFSTLNQHRVDVSPYPYKELYRVTSDVSRWGLTTFGILHRWTGLTLCNSPRPCPDHDPPKYEPHCGDETCDDDHAT